MGEWARPLFAADASPCYRVPPTQEMEGDRLPPQLVLSLHLTYLTCTLSINPPAATPSSRSSTSPPQLPPRPRYASSSSFELARLAYQPSLLPDAPEPSSFAGSYFLPLRITPVNVSLCPRRWRRFDQVARPSILPVCKKSSQERAIGDQTHVLASESSGQHKLSEPWTSRYGHRNRIERIVYRLTGRNCVNESHRCYAARNLEKLVVVIAYPPCLHNTIPWLTSRLVKGLLDRFWLREIAFNHLTTPARTRCIPSTSPKPRSTSFALSSPLAVFSEGILPKVVSLHHNTCSKLAADSWKTRLPAQTELA
ncbi:MAG: hypothetical protein Q9206_000262 [Seirophora lacunosa]